MNRDLCYHALMLRSRPSGEANRELWLLTAEAGLLHATVFGGPKSKLRSYASPFHSGKVWIYHNPANDSRKISDFDVQSWRPGLRELYERVMTADAVAETILASHGGGGNGPTALLLAEAALDALALADSETCVQILVCFLWQWTDFLGLKPDLDHCSHCGKDLPANSVILFSPREGAMVCESCLDPGHRAALVKAGPGCRKWLETVRPLSPSRLHLFTPDAASLREAMSLTTAILAGAFGKRLKSWQF